MNLRFRRLPILASAHGVSKASALFASALLLSPLLEAQVIVTPASPTVIQADGAADPSQGIQGLPAGGVVSPGRPAPNAAADPAEARLQSLLQVRLDRRPESLLQAAAQPFTSGAAGSPVTNEVERFRLDVLTGNWRAVAALLTSLPTNQAPRLYDHVLGQLSAVTGQSGPPGSPPTPMPPGAPGMPPSGPFLLPDDILTLANLSPNGLTESVLQKLGPLLARALQGQGALAPVLARLEAGVDKLGGPEPHSRHDAARLLIAAGRLTETARFLPALDTNAPTRDFSLWDAHASLLAAQARDSSRSGENAARQRKEFLGRAWDLNQVLLDDATTPAKEREAALGRALELVPELGREFGSNWLQQSFVRRPDLGAAILAQVGGKVARGATERQAAPRAKNLQQQRYTVDVLLRANGPPDPWRGLLQILAAGWLREAEFTRSRPATPQNLMPQQFDAFGNPIFTGGPQRFQDGNQPEPISAADLLASAPNELWTERLDPPLAGRIRVLLLQLRMRTLQYDQALSAIESVAAEDAVLARNLVHELLNGWVEARQPNRPNYYGPRFYSPYMTPGGEGIPLTRAHQQRNLDQLARLLARVQRLPIEPPDDTVVVSAFTRAHSTAEVFSLIDIERVFGPIHSLRTETVSELLQTMRSRLATQWRQPRVQQDARTKRNDKEIAAEVRRGYELVSRLASEALKRRPDDWRLTLARAATLYDWAEFEYGMKVDLAVYTSRRDQAFQLFQTAADLYAADLSKLEEDQQVPRVYQQWFNATLGASDLAYLTRQAEPSTNQLARIRAAMLALPGEAAERHLAAFSKGLADAGGGLKPELKPRYLRAGLEIAGDHPDARDARELVRHYDDLLREIVLDLRIDGDAIVGHGMPFGVFVAIRHTEAVGRESGGFARYLQNQGNMGYYYNPFGGGPVNYRDEFEKQVREKYSDGFDVLTVTFHDDKVQPRGTDQPGWRDFPYAYLLLKAKDASVDKLPPLQLSMDFSDARGQVSLPVVSAPVLIDARPDSPPLRPVRDLDIVQMLDDRDLARRTANLEIKAAARGLVPDLDRILEVHIPRFRVVKNEDRGLTLSGMDAEADVLAPISERVWLLSLEPDTSAGEASSFAFLKPRQDGTKLTCKRYADADLVEVPAEVTLERLPYRTSQLWTWVAGGVVLAALGLVFWFRRRPPETNRTRPPIYTLPREITPFSVIHLLQRLLADQRLGLTPQQRRELSSALDELQRGYFDRPANGEPPPDLHRLATHWVNAAVR